MMSGTGTKMIGLVAALLLLSAAVGGGRDRNSAPPENRLIALKGARTLKDFHEAVVEAAEERSRMIATLTGILRAEEDREKRVRACFLLGAYRADEPVDDLAGMITLKSGETGRLRTELPLWGEYPAVDALIKIGCPSRRAMIGNIESSDDAKVRDLSARVIREVYGPDLAKVLIRNAAQTQGDAEKRARLEAVLKSF